MESKILRKEYSLIWAMLSYVSEHVIIKYVYEGRSESIHSPPQTNTKDLFTHIRLDYLKIFTIEVQSFSKAFQSRRERERNIQVLKRTST